MIMDYQVHPFSFNEAIKYMQAVYVYLFIYLLSCLHSYHSLSQLCRQLMS